MGQGRGLGGKERAKGSLTRVVGSSFFHGATALPPQFLHLRRSSNVKLAALWRLGFGATIECSL